jgi:hypothetical protein
VNGAERSAPELLARRATLRQLEDAIDQLKPVEATIVRKRFGIPDGEEDEERTLADIGREHGLSRERIRQIEAEALVKLRRALARAERAAPPRGRLRPRAGEARGVPAASRRQQAGVRERVVDRGRRELR